MEIAPLKSFLAIAREGHLTRAARARHLSQPAVSAQLARLEDELGTALFHQDQYTLTTVWDNRFANDSALRILAPGHQTVAQANRFALRTRLQPNRDGELASLTLPDGTTRVIEHDRHFNRRSRASMVFYRDILPGFNRYLCDYYRERDDA